MAGYDRSAQLAGAFGLGKPLVVGAPHREAPARDGFDLLHLRPQKRRDDLPGQERRTDVDPGVLVDLTTKELTSVGALFADDLGALGEARVVDQQRPTL